MPSELFVPKQRVTNFASNHEQTPQRRSSLKKKMLSKVLSSRTSSTRVNEQFNNSCTSLQPERSSSETIRKAATPSSPALDGTIASCIELSGPTKPSATRPAHLPPSQRPILRLQLTLQPDIQELDTEEERSLWVTTTITAEALLAQDDVPDMPLNVAIVLDNSAYSSTDCLKAACRAVLNLAYQLDNPHDHMAILCTSPAQDWRETRSGFVLRKLTPVDMQSIQHDLRLASHARTDIAPQRLDMTRTMSEAFHILANGDDMERTGGAYCHVVVFSSNPQACCGSMASSAPVPIHFVQPGVLPWRPLRRYWNGWQISEADLARAMVDKFAEMIRHTRARTSPGMISKLQIKVESIPETCNIEEILGKQRHETLAPGEQLYLLVKVRTKSRTTTQVTSEADVLFDELEGMLGIAYAELFTVTVSYSHSLFSSNTILTSQVICSIPRRSTIPQWTSLSTPLVGTQSIESSQEMYKRLCLAVATSTYPQAALKLLRRLSPPSGSSSTLLGFLASIKTELSYQVDTVEKYDLGIDTTEYIEYRSRRSIADCMPHTNPPEQSPSSAQTALMPIAESPDSGKTTIYEKYSSLEEEDVNDAARKIWKDMRRDSKSTRDLLMMRSVTLSALNGREVGLAELQKQALRSKRSIGQDTLRSLSLGTVSAPQNRYAPWL